MNFSWDNKKICKSFFLNGKSFPEKNLFTKKIAELINREEKEKSSAL